MIFKTGQRVICTKEHDGNTSIIGKSGTIIGHVCGKLYVIQFDERIKRGHGCGETDCDTGQDINGKYGYCWNIYSNKLRLYSINKRID